MCREEGWRYGIVVERAKKKSRQGKVSPVKFFKRWIYKLYQISNTQSFCRESCVFIRDNDLRTEKMKSQNLNNKHKQGVILLKRYKWGARSDEEWW